MSTSNSCRFLQFFGFTFLFMVTTVGCTRSSSLRSAIMGDDYEHVLEEMHRLRDEGSVAVDPYVILYDAPMTPLEFAVFAGKLEAARALLDSGASVEGPDSTGSPLETACASGDARMVSLLLERGAISDGPSETGGPLYYAARNRHVEVVELLLDSGADPLIERSFPYGQTRTEPVLFVIVEFACRDKVTWERDDDALVELLARHSIPLNTVYNRQSGCTIQDSLGGKCSS